MEQIQRDLGRIEGKLDTLLEQTAARHARIDERLDKVEQRQGRTERVMARAAGAAATAVMLAGAAWRWFTSGS